MTGNDLIASSLRLINVLASGETPGASEANDGLMILNQMLDSWSTERLAIFNVSRQLFNLVNGTQAYTLGTGGTFNAARPPRIERIGIVDNSSGDAVEYPCEMIGASRWAEVVFKAQQGSHPYAMWDDNGFPLRTLNFYPIPGPTMQAAIYAWTALTQFADLTTDYTFPPGYMKALRYGLAVDLAPEFGAQASATVISQAIEAKAKVRTLNVKEVLLRTEFGSERYGSDYYAIRGGQ